MIRRIFQHLPAFAYLSVAACIATAAPGPEMSQGIREFREAYEAWSDEAFERAARTLSTAAANDGGSAVGYHWLGVVQFHQVLQKQSQPGNSASTAEVVKFREAAIKTLTLALEKDPKDAEAHAMLGTMMGMKVDGLVSALRFGPSISRYRDQALAAGPDNPRVQYLLGTAQYHTAKKAADYEAALKTLQKAERLFAAEEKTPLAEGDARWGYDACLVFLGRTQEALGRREEAASCFRKALTLRPSDDGAKEGLKRTTTAG
jgi:tetratricopeptide (TPR) repeat protein